MSSPGIPGSGIASAVQRRILYEGVDRPLWMYDASQSSSIYFELNITGNVRRLRGGKALSTAAPLASDLGGYRYTAFGHLNTTDTATPYPTAKGQKYEQPLRWQSHWYIDYGSGLYDFRARVWSPELAAFLQADEFGFLSRTGTLWSWPGQNPFLYADPSGRGPFGRWIGSLIGETLGGEIGAAVGVGIGGAATIETGPGALVGAGVGGVEGGITGAEVGGLAGGIIGDRLEEALKSLIVNATAKGSGRGRFKRGIDASEQLEDIKEAQQAKRKQGRGCEIESTTKSEQRDKNALGRVRNEQDAVEEFGDD